jgi:protein translocase SecG subunit
MSLLFGFLTFILVVNCLFLILLVLVQLPKKEAGAGLAFGAGAVDTLIGAGSGNALTKLTKYAAGSFLALAVVLAVLNAQRHRGTDVLERELARKASATPALPSQTAPAPAPITAPATGPLENNAAAPLSLTNIAVPAPTEAATSAPTPTAEQPEPAPAP